MLRYLINRLIMAAAVALTVSVIGFLLLRASGDLAATLAGENASAADVAEVAKLYGLDRPLYVQ
jgi:peptide/nickel transport system permease protein